MPEPTAGPRRAVETTAANLRVDSATAEVLRALDAAGIESILLKGASTLDWLYGEGEEPRRYIDGDLLVPTGAEPQVAAALRSLGFEPEVDEPEMPRWWREHAVAWSRRNGTMIDIHRSLPGIGADPAALWQRLAADAVPFAVGGYECRALSLPARALHLALHAGQHGHAGDAAVADLERALARGDDETWRAAADLARDLDATAAFGAGLRLVAAGRARLERLGLASERGLEAELRASPATAPALTVERIARTPGLRARATVVLQKLFPPATFMRKWSPLAARSRVGLTLAYAGRPFWVIAQAPAAIRDWWRVRRSLRRDA